MPARRVIFPPSNNCASQTGGQHMRIARLAMLIAITLGYSSAAVADEKETPKAALPAGAVPVDDLKKQAAKQQMTRQTPKHMSQTRLGVGDFFRKLFGPSEPKINGTVIGGAQTYKNGISPVAPIIPR